MTVGGDFVSHLSPILGLYLAQFCMIFFFYSQCLVVAKFSMHHGPVHSVQR